MTGSVASMVGFGASYAIASLTCTIAPFLAVVVGGFRSGGVLDGIALVLAYAAGKGLVVGTVAVATALASRSLINRMRSAGAWAPRVAGGLLAAAGAYVAYYGWSELRVLDGADPSDPVTGAAAAVQRELASLVATPGALGWLLIRAVLVLVSLAFGRLRRGDPVPEPGRSAPADPLEQCR